jgi:predicted dehydrogenase
MQRDDSIVHGSGSDRRAFLKTSAVAATALAARPLWSAAGSDTIRIGLIGCGGRGQGAVMNAIAAADGVVVTALGDVLPERVRSAQDQLQEAGDRFQVTAERCFSGFDAFEKVIATDCNMVILATPPHFRPQHLEAAIRGGKHVFMEKPVAVDAPGVRTVIASGEVAAKNGLGIVTGTQRRHQKSYLETLARLHDGAIGEIVAGEVAWDQGSLWMNPRKPEWSDMEWQLRNWLYFTWLSGDHIVEQHVHNLDVMNWVMNAHPRKARGSGGRQVRTDAAYGHIFDHFNIAYEFEGGARWFSSCRQIDGCSNWVGEHAIGTKGSANPHGSIGGPAAWNFSGEERDPYEQEHVDLIASIRAGKPLNEARRIAESTLTAIMGRMAAYSGQEVTWQQAMDSTETWAPPQYAFGDLAVAPVPMPGKTKLT